MAINSGNLVLAIIGVIMTGVVIVVAIFSIYLCTKVALLGSDVRSQRRTPPLPNGSRSSRSGADADIEMGGMSYFIEGLQNERPIRFSAQQLRGFTNNYSRKVGSGGFGVVYRGRFPGGEPVAVKVLNSTLGKQAEEQFMAEALVYEYMEKGSLDRYLFDSPPERISFDKLYEIAVGTARAVRYLHEECAQRIIHYDIKPENVLLGAGLAPKVSDFGLAKLCDREDTHLTITGARGTPGYAAPELWMPLPVTHKCDVYSYGMLLFEILGRRRNLKIGAQHGQESQDWYPRWVWHRFEAGETEAVLARARAADGKEREKAGRVCKVALWCVQYRPEDRPSMGNVVRMLEGEDDIDAPHNPFPQLAPYSACHMPSVLTTAATTESDAGAARTG
ncbi:LEAF RUST 10 DISEASE-RESISTANCE LOCUS RECEPTOR-LIKE PROTEIN KINASE-like 2.4 [Oryza brachyantha]|uniref:LEAF RUST 10 DISEASE-RESISTANCE LOCUS RECEPTOR-LIKE PROTEIN KINASE-like 2.4 n=1 Tax=Oryza brachyantha TaxID=4533 RepID=UPI001ADAD19C|nr:LEAF RUST 10 DISEASE-RESISTANCE LOCUS RECEPTOR-LIKE PROTEIN KINASE-like 2.4 [Oryza brachyantha]